MHRDAIRSGEIELVLRKPGNKFLAVSISEVSKERLGGRYDKSRLKVFPMSGDRVRNAEIGLVLKRASVDSGDTNLFGDERLGMESALRYYERWKFLKMVGVPTVSSMRVIDEYRIAMGDMTVGGGEFFGKAKKIAIMLELEKGIRRELSPLEKTFLNIDTEAIKQKVADLQEIAWKNEVRLPGDDQYDLLVRPDGSFQVIVMDLSRLRRKGSESYSDLLNERSGFNSELDDFRSGLKRLGTPRDEYNG
ncbi:MAG TPA: hypothetical protein VI791_04215 [Patescibacteria group bacterium]|nr:hypothetical protein [Patescibacteria group bacterium]